MIAKEARRGAGHPVRPARTPDFSLAPCKGENRMTGPSDVARAREMFFYYLSNNLQVLV